MKRFETPILKVEKFNLQNILTTSGDIPPVEPEKAKATELAAADIVGVEQVFTITL